MKEAIVAIDFGTSGTTYAFAFMDAKDDIITAKWDIPDAKNSTEIILEEDDYGNLKVLQFGDNCKTYLRRKDNEGKIYYHFKDIKMKLYDNQTSIKSSNNDKVLKLDVVISKILITIKEAALKEIKSYRPLTDESKIDWKVTVPAIWKNKSKEIMLKASKLAGLFKEKEDQSLFFCLEPEGAACDYVSEKTSDCNAIEIGRKYIICDIGGGTVDISTHKRIKENNKIYIEEVYPPIGGNHGSSYINKNFMDRVITKIFGKNAMDKLEKKINSKEDEDIYEEYYTLLQQIEEFKKISSELKDDVKRIDCSLFEEIVDEDISNLIDEYNNNCPSDWKIKKKKGFKIFFPYKIMIDLTKELIVDKVVNHLYNIIDDVSDINSIIYAGSVASNQFIISMINNQLPNRIQKYNSSYPSLAIVKGAVIFGLNPFAIKARISKYTLGVQTREKWDELEHGKRNDLKYFDEKDKCYYCKNRFSPIILKNKKINVDEIVKKNYSISYSNVNIIFLKTLFNDVKFTDETESHKRKCIKFGETEFNVGESYDENNKDLIIELKLGGTYINAKIIYNEIEKSIPFDFSNED